MTARGVPRQWRACDLPVLSQCGNMAREGLRTLVVAKRALTEEQYQDFEVSWQPPLGPPSPGGQGMGVTGWTVQHLLGLLETRT